MEITLVLLLIYFVGVPAAVEYSRRRFERGGILLGFVWPMVLLWDYISEHHERRTYKRTWR